MKHIVVLFTLLSGLAFSQPTGKPAALADGSNLTSPTTWEAFLDLPADTEAALGGKISNTAAALSTVISTDPAAIRTAAGLDFVSVADFGAVGNGTADDTGSIQNAITALETTGKSTLFFPRGTYRLATRTTNSDSGSSSNVFLRLGVNDLAGRDIKLIGQAGTVIRADTTVRSHTLQVYGKMRSLKVEGIRFEKIDTPLPSTVGEPNGCDAIAFLQHDTREIDLVEVTGCVFYNTHRAFSFYCPATYGNLVRGLVREFRFQNNSVINPWGSNTINGASAVGGGQQVLVNAWVRNGVLTGNHFLGCLDTANLTNNPGGVPKDGTIFGNPENLVFSNNTLRNFGVEAIYHASGASQRGLCGAFVVPAIGSNVTVTLIGQSTFILDERVFAYSANLAAEMKVVSWDSDTRALVLQTVASTGSTAAPGVNLANPIILGKNDEPAQATIANNTIHISKIINGGTYSSGGAIYLQSRAVITGNTIIGFGSGVILYKNIALPGGLAADGSVVSGNVFRGLPGNVTDTQAGISVGQSNCLISGNSIFYDVNQRRHGIQVSANNTTVSGNIARVVSPVNNGYLSVDRSVAYCESPGFTGNIFSGNYSSGFDVGVGPRNVPSNQKMTVTSHRSNGDVIAVDSTSGDITGIDTRSLLDSIAVVRNLRPTAFVANYGGSAAAWGNGWKFVSGTELSTSHIVRFETPLAAADATTAANIPFSVAMNLRQAASAAGVEMCFGIGATYTAIPAVGSNKLSGRGFGFRLNAGNIYLFHHDGTTYTEETAVAYTTGTISWRPVILSWDGVSKLKLLSIANTEVGSVSRRATTVIKEATIPGLAAGNFANLGEMNAWITTGTTGVGQTQGYGSEVKILVGQAF